MLTVAAVRVSFCSLELDEEALLLGMEELDSLLELDSEDKVELEIVASLDLEDLFDSWVSLAQEAMVNDARVIVRSSNDLFFIKKPSLIL